MKRILTPGHRQEVTVFEMLMEQTPLRGGRPGQGRQRPAKVAGDKGYSAGQVRNWLKAKGIATVIPRKANEQRKGWFDKAAYRKRNVVERAIGRFKFKYRRLATRYDKLGSHFLAFWAIASIISWATF